MSNPHDRTATTDLVEAIHRQQSKVEILARSEDAMSYRLRKAAERELVLMQNSLRDRDGGEQ